MIKPFHLAIPVTDLAKATTFYESVLGCSRGREDEHWIDFNLYGHQLVCHLSNTASEQISNPVDGDNIPVPHFGVILDFQEFDALAERLRKNNQEFIVEPRTRFKGEAGEQRTMFICDPSNNAIELKAFANLDTLFKP
ncbi:VOC family protein [Gammaproteobacteria bacterium]|nr:VOC family protein [Gammaproteobacteria bacterium]